MCTLLFQTPKKICWPCLWKKEKDSLSDNCRCAAGPDLLPLCFDWVSRSCQHTFKSKSFSVAYLLKFWIASIIKKVVHLSDPYFYSLVLTCKIYQLFGKLEALTHYISREIPGNQSLPDFSWHIADAPNISLQKYLIIWYSVVPLRVLVPFDIVQWIKVLMGKLPACSW